LYNIASSIVIVVCLVVAYRMYNYSIFAATSVGEGPSADGSFLTSEDSELTNTLTHLIYYCVLKAKGAIRSSDVLSS